MTETYDALLIVGFGGPEGRDDVIPFLENVLRGRNVPRERMLEVAEHYYHFGGVSPINQQVRDLIAVLEPELRRQQIELPVHWGNRNWHPLLTETMRELTDNGACRVLALVLAAYSSYSSCRQYREDIERARQAVGEAAPVVDKIRVFYNHPDFIAPSAERIREAWQAFDEAGRQRSHIAFTAHSIPSSMADQCAYETQLTETCRLIAEELQIPEQQWALVYQSRSGRPQDPWLEPDICDHLRTLHSEGVDHVVVMPVGFLSDHMEVLFDLDEEARGVAEELQMHYARAATVGTHPRFVRMLAELVKERMQMDLPRQAVGQFGPSHDVCPIDCCPAPARPGRPGQAVSAGQPGRPAEPQQRPEQSS